MLILGIDPGVNGGMAILGDGYAPATRKFDGATEHDIAEWLREFPPVTAAFIERVASSPQMGVVSAFTFGRSYGFLRGLLVGSQVPFHEVSPAVWQKAMGCRTKGDKNVSKAAAQRLWPTLKITHANADALLIAEYGRRIQIGGAS